MSSGSIQPRGPGKFLLRWEAAPSPDGKRRQRSRIFTGGIRAARAELARLVAEADQAGNVDPGKMTVGEYLKRWLADYAKRNVSPKTYERYEEIMEKHLVPGLGRHQLAKLQTIHIQGYYTHALESGRRDGRGGLAPQTVVHHHRLLSQALNHAVDWDLLTKNPARKAKPPAIEQQEPDFLTFAEAAALLRAVESSRHYVPLTLAICTGLRRGEVLALRWVDVNLETGMATVVQSLEETKDGMRFKPPKSKKGRRTVDLGAFMVEELRKHKAEQSQRRLLLGPAYQDQGLICEQGDGRPFEPRNYSKAFYDLMRRHPELKRVRLHDLRHTHISLMIASGAHPKVIQERAGHSTAQFTMDKYGHLIPGLQTESVETFDQQLRDARERAAPPPPPPLRIVENG